MGKISPNNKAYPEWKRKREQRQTNQIDIKRLKCKQKKRLPKRKRQ